MEAVGCDYKEERDGVRGERGREKREAREAKEEERRRTGGVV